MRYPENPEIQISSCSFIQFVRIVINQRGQGDDDPLQVGTPCAVFQVFIIKTEVRSQFYLENGTHISLRTRILTNSEFYMWPTTYYQPGTFLITSDTPVAAAQAWPPNTGLNTTLVRKQPGSFE